MSEDLELLIAEQGSIIEKQRAIITMLTDELEQKNKAKNSLFNMSTTGFQNLLLIGTFFMGGLLLLGALFIK